MINIGPRSGLVLSALTSVAGLMLAKAAWNSGIPEPATWNWSYSSWASSSETALAKPNRNWSKVRVMARCRFAGLDNTAEDALRALIGSGSTPRDGAGEIAQVAAASPRP